MPIDFSKFQKKEISPRKIKKILPEVKIISEEKLPKIIEDIDFLNMRITQDDLWFLYHFKFGKSTRTKRSILLPQFTETFNRNLNEIKK